MRLDNLDDGSKLQAAYHDALQTSYGYFKALHNSADSASWKPVSLPESVTGVGRPSSSAKGLGKAQAENVAVHRRTSKYGDVYRATVEVDCGSDISVDTFRGCLVTPETRAMWDRMVEEATTLDILDAHTRVTKTNYRLGWPSSPRDAVTISKTFVDSHTLIDISTSLPRSKHEPAYLRPAPPYVRAHVSLLAWCIQLPSSPAVPEGPAEGQVRVSCFWNWNPKGTWAVGGGVPQHLPFLVAGLINHVRDGSDKVPVLSAYGPDVSIGSVSYDTSRVTLNVHYAIVSTASQNEETESLRRQVEFGLSSTQSWDIQISVKTQLGKESSSTIWTSFVRQAANASPDASPPKRLVLRFAHSPLEPDEELVRVNVSIERTSSSTAGVRINGIPVAVERAESDSHFSERVEKKQRPLLEDTASLTGVSLRTMNTTAEKKGPRDDQEGAVMKGRSSLIRRNYIYFTSLLQEPEPKWKPVLDSRGVAIHQLDSIDKTLVVYRAEAVFVGVGIWDLFAVLATPGARSVWDKTHEDATLVEDVNELTDLWHLQSKAAWPVSARDSVMLRTTYKSPSSVHLFGFSIEDTNLFPSIPPSTDPTVIRTQIDLQGWSIESLSPNTTQVTLLEQSDPRGWSGKGSIPQVMMSTLAGVGEFAIKHGGPPVCTRLGGARTLLSRYDVEAETFKIEYQPAKARRSASSSIATSFFPTAPSSSSPISLPMVRENSSDDGSLRSVSDDGSRGKIECEIRCDTDQWSNSFAIVIDPPQQNISALRRHKLSPNAGGLWLTIEHDPVLLHGGKVAITVRRGVAVQGSKTQVIVNGSKVKVDVEDLPEAKVQLLKKQKRGRPTRAPLDQPPGLRLRKKPSTDLAGVSTAFAPASPLLPSPTSTWGKMASKWYTLAAESTRSAIIPVPASSPLPQVGRTPVEASVNALKQLSRIHTDRDGESTAPDAWQPVSERDGLKIEKRIVSHVSETFPVFRAGRIIEGFTAEEVSASVGGLREDERFEKPTVLEEYGWGIKTSHVVAHTTFPFRGRSLLVASVVARMAEPAPPSPSIHGPQTPLSTIFHSRTSNFDPLTTNLDASKYNPTSLPPGNMILEGWILETIDPYSHEQYAIPSTRCMYLASVDYSCSMPLSVNNVLNQSLPRSLLAIESILKNEGPPSRGREPGMVVLAPEQKERLGSSEKVGWGLENVDEGRMGVQETNDGDEYSLSVVLQAGPPSSSASPRDGSGTLSPPLKHTDSRSSVNSRSTVIDLGEEIRKGRKDLMVMEVEIGSKAVKNGCEIELNAVSLPVALHSTSSGSEPGTDGTTTPTGLSATASIDGLPLTLPNQPLGLPFKVSVISLAPSVLQAASLDPSLPPRHLLRVTLPTSGFDAPIINDPLTGPGTPMPRPRWLLDLINDGAVVSLKLKVTKSQESKILDGEAPEGVPNKPVYSYQQEEVVVQDEKRAKHLGLRDGTRPNVPQLVAVPSAGDRDPNDKRIVRRLDKPLAVREEYTKEGVKVLRDKMEIKDKDSRRESDVEVVQENTHSPEPQSALAEQSRYSYNFWRYPRLPRFSASAPGTANGSPTKVFASPPPSSVGGSAAAGEDKAKAVVLSSNTSPNGPVATGTELQPSGLREQANDALRPVTTLPGLVIACILCFLLGSLLRSLLSEADFVIYQPATTLSEMLPGTQGVGEQWRELKRLAEWKIGWDRDLVIAIARRG
ncbi:hypothetical protein B9479_000638 [Cryptococcus floricola]|uniref:START domain-containing protein n=1 Tax=Cryptococcus floricola TaxID=2591691 RepID=A0A5D3B793_9TREE|nr:hypothetical protein B9479_000638 [Cryptococcus floricola]